MDQTLTNIGTLGGLRSAGYQTLPVRMEMRRNLLARLRAKERILPGIIGYDRDGGARNRKRHPGRAIT